MTDEGVIPDWQISEVRERMAQYEKGKAHYLDFDSALDEIEKELAI